MIQSLMDVRRFLCVGIILCAVSFAATGVAVADAPIHNDGNPVLLSVGDSSLGPHLVALSDASLAHTTGAGLAPPAVALRLPSRGRVTLWDELRVKPQDIGPTGGQVSITINNR